MPRTELPLRFPSAQIFTGFVRRAFYSPRLRITRWAYTRVYGARFARAKTGEQNQGGRGGAPRRADDDSIEMKARVGDTHTHTPISRRADVRVREGSARPLQPCVPRCTPPFREGNGGERPLSFGRENERAVSRIPVFVESVCACVRVRRRGRSLTLIPSLNCTIRVTSRIPPAAPSSSSSPDPRRYRVIVLKGPVFPVNGVRARRKEEIGVERVGAKSVQDFVREGQCARTHTQHTRTPGIHGGPVR